MWILAIILSILIVVAVVGNYIRIRIIKKRIEKGELDKFPEVIEVEEECCGQHSTCEKDSLLAAVSKQIEYYDDEELDRFINREADSYDDKEIEMFRDVLYTTQEIEVAGWIRSLQLRGIQLPDELKDEVFLIIGERRIHP